MASKSDKRRCLSLSASSDFRFAAAVGQKNKDEYYTVDIAAKNSLSPGKHHANHAASADRITELRREKINTGEFKKQRMANKKLRSALRHRKEVDEGVTYQSNYTLLTEPGIHYENVAEINNNQDVAITIFDEENDGIEAIVLLDLKTSGFQHNCDILQIAAQCNGRKFATYIKEFRYTKRKCFQQIKIFTFY